MEFEITCDCGWSFRGREDDVVAATIAHGRSVHQIELTRGAGSPGRATGARCP